MTNDSESLFPSGPTTRRGLLSAFSRRAAEAVPIPEGLLPRSPVERDEVDHFEEPTPSSIEPFLSGEALIAEIRASEEDTGMHIWWLGQSGFLVQIADECILFDPYLSDSVTTRYSGSDTPHERITGLVVEPSLLSFVNVVTSSHAHQDHLDPGTLPHVLAGDAAFVCAEGSEKVAAERAGRQPDAVLGVGDDATFGTFTINAVPAYHEGAPEAVGYVVRCGAYAFYHAGDTRRVQGVAEAVQPYGADVAFVPISGLHGNMDGTDAARLAYESAAIIAIPCHYEMFKARHGEHPPVRCRVCSARSGVQAPARGRAHLDRLRILTGDDRPPGVRQRASQPLSRTTGDPVNERPPGPRRKAATSATSSGSSSRLSACGSRITSRSASSSEIPRLSAAAVTWSATRGVRTKPGQSATARMPSAAPSSARDLTRPTAPCFAATYPALKGEATRP